MKSTPNDISNAKASGQVQRDASRQEQNSYKLSASQIHSFSPEEMQNFVNSIKNAKIQLRVVNPASLATPKDTPLVTTTTSTPKSPPMDSPPKPTTQITNWLNTPSDDTSVQTLPPHSHVNFQLINKKPKRRKRYHIPLHNIVQYNNNILYDNYTIDNLNRNNNNNTYSNASELSTNTSPEEEASEPAAPLMALPPINEESLDKILELLSHTHNAANREKISLSIIRQGYVRQLLDLFLKCEQARNLPKLQCLFNIFKSMIMLNETNLLEFLFSDEYMLDVIGALEYDPELKRRIKHREFLKEHAVFKQVVPIKKAELITRIHQTFRLQYLKDVVLPRQLDDTTFSTINSLIFFNQVEIVSQIQADDQFLNDLFALLKQDVKNLPQAQMNINNNNNTISQENQALKDRILFVQELCTLAKNLHMQSRLSFFETLYRHGICDVLQSTVLHPDTGIRLATVNILDNMATHDSTLLRSHILLQKNETPPYQLLTNVIKAFLYDHESGIRVQLNDIIRALLDVANLVEAPEKDEFLNVFYGEPITTLLEPFNKEDVAYEDSVKENICDILSFCVQHHGYRIKYFILGNNIVPKILNLLKRKEKHLVLAAIRFFRTFVGLKDDFYNRHVTKFNLFEPVMQTFKENGPRYNLINSAIIELLEFIRKENIKHLILHIAEHYKGILSEVTYVETCKLLLIKAEQLQESNATPSTTPVASRTVTPSRFQTEEEDYFKEDDQEPTEPSRPPNNSPEHAAQNSSTRPNRLVDYDDVDVDDSDTSSDTEPANNGPKAPGEEDNNLKRKETEPPTAFPEHGPPVPKLAAHEDDTTILKKKPKISINIKPVSSSPPNSPPATNNTNSETSPEKQT